MTRPALALALLLGACASDPTPPAGGVTAAPPDVPDPEALSVARAPVAITVDTRALAERPLAPLVVEGACPFEGCTYGTWTTSAETTVYGRGGDSTRVAFTVPAGTQLEASRGLVLLTRLGVSVATRATELFLSFEEAIPVAEGDTVRVLDYEGEGSYRVWYDGQIAFSDVGTGIEAPPGRDADAAFRRVVAAQQQWWARVTAPDGRAGWLWMDRTPPVTGADALG